MKRLWILLLLPTIWIYGCGSDSGGSAATLNPDLRVLASNIIISNANAAESSSVATLAAAVDTQTQILASNVVVDDSQLRITAGTVQEAFDEIVPDLATFLVGTWDTLSYSMIPASINQYDPPFDRAPGSITFNADGTYTLNAGTFAIFRECDENRCVERSENLWHVEEGAILGFANGRYSDYCYPINYSRQKMTLLQGDRIVIMTKQP